MGILGAAMAEMWCTSRAMVEHRMNGFLHEDFVYIRETSFASLKGL
jgi:hypothetical protein